MRKPQQLELPTWGGRRLGAGRRPKGRSALVSHKARQPFDRPMPVHVTLRARISGLRAARATDRARAYFAPYPPSSPSIGILRDGKLVFMLQRSEIENRDARQIAERLTAAFDQLCELPTRSGFRRTCR